MRKFVIGDVHGDYKKWSKMMKLINLQDEDVLVSIGDVIGRGVDGIKILKEIMERKNSHMVLGNHEYMMYNAIHADINDLPDKQEYIDEWMDNEGYPTVQSFAKESDAMQEKILSYINKAKVHCKVKLEDGRIFTLAHGWLNDPDEEDFVWKTVWTRPERCEKPSIELEGQLIIGHTPTPEFYTMNEMRHAIHPRILHAPYFIDIDCGCGIGDGTLAALCLDTMEEFYIN